MYLTCVLIFIQQLPHSQPALSEAQREKLLMKWQQSDPKFKFEKRLTQLSQHLNIPNESGRLHLMTLK